ncbi:hypothetical protein JRO89_XS08G0034700 [Xanthoceras sorbifolium]|uniref:Uncharacterized protein n=1 Tax=Xanthoceras sorbifolium TaxID=99658 RepID=A0ABQ8HNG1_9ROSI|nr:hypothetical protein JRO89_XS08G0034700 [Xanthoceras sorbifolium]
MHNYNHLEASDGFASVAYLIECDQCRNSGCISRVHNFGVALVRHENKQAAEEDKDIFEGRLHLPATDVGNLSQFNIETNEVFTTLAFVLKSSAQLYGITKLQARVVITSAPSSIKIETNEVIEFFKVRIVDFTYF